MDIYTKQRKEFSWKSFTTLSLSLLFFHFELSDFLQLFNKKIFLWLVYILQFAWKDMGWTFLNKNKWMNE